MSASSGNGVVSEESPGGDLPETEVRGQLFLAHDVPHPCKAEPGPRAQKRTSARLLPETRTVGRKT